MSTYSQGVMGDGAAILKDGQLMTVDEIVAELQRGADGRLVAAGLLAGFALRVRCADTALRDERSRSSSQTSAAIWKRHQRK